MKKIKDESFGIIALKCIKRHYEVLFVKHGKGHWAFPKGHAEPGETPIQTAVRELKEETGLTIKKILQIPSIEEHYFFRLDKNLVEKKVTYFLAEVEGEVEIQKDEISDHRWVTLKEADSLATFPETKRLCRKVLEILEEDYS